MNSLHFNIHCDSHTGIRRSNNEDCVVVDESHSLIVLADGMGGHKAGEVASAMAANGVMKNLGHWLEKSRETTISRNLKKAIIEGAVMVTIVLLLFLMSFRTSFITLMAMPLSFAVTLLTFKWIGLSVNSMTLGGLAVAIGMVVDDAIVDVENVFRRLRENARIKEPLPKLEVIAQASG